MMAQPVNILFLVTGLNRGGAETMLLRLLERLDRSKFSPSVLVILERGPLSEQVEALGIPLKHLNMKIGRPNPLAMWPLIRHVKKQKPDVIQGWMYHGNLAGTLAARWLRRATPVIWNVRQSVYDLGYETRSTAALIRLGARWSKHPAKIVYNVQVSARQHEALGYRADKRVVIPNGFDVERYRPCVEWRSESRAALGIAQDAPVVGLVARYHPMKDHHTFLKAAALLRQDHPKIQFVLVGKDVEPNNGELAQLLNELGLQPGVHLLGEQTDVARWMNAFDIAASSSFTEGFSNVIGEAMMCGLPCVVTDVGDSAEIVGDTGKAVPPRSPEAMAQAWSELLSMSDKARSDLGKAARNRAMEHFGIKHVVAQYEALYKSVLTAS